ncbi:hypothetical protein [Candidatus Chloroploca sp. Khr17]|uniref:hypothetical protein n=1 Tax=Candidatus Chloroploca sp. Khr17 TaxID=2496869 RepID=UPI00101BEEBF|nr:hypothetical protein [Candidatus Chloroploca sp. Khr17]
MTFLKPYFSRPHGFVDQALLDETTLLKAERPDAPTTDPLYTCFCVAPRLIYAPGEPRLVQTLSWATFLTRLPMHGP